MLTIEPQEVSDAEVAFPASVSHLLPKREDIPEEFKRHNGTKWNQLFSDWFYRGLKESEFIPKEGVDVDKALRHIKCCMGSWEPKQQHKEAGVAYLLSLWFEDVKYTKGDPQKE